MINFSRDNQDFRISGMNSEGSRVELKNLLSRISLIKISDFTPARTERYVRAGIDEEELSELMIS
ncbi:MAG: hypothetical protein ACJ75B_16865 [Flavisolibacter sp.]